MAAPGAPVLESWTLLSALAALTTRVRLGTLVLGNTYRPSAAVANMAASLDQVAGGRVVLGLAPAAAQRASRVRHRSPAGGRADGPVSTRPATSSPRCCGSGTAPSTAATTGCGMRRARLAAAAILVGGGGPRPNPRDRAKYADIWHAWASPPEFLRKCEILDRHCTQVGRDPADLDRATGSGRAGDRVARGPHRRTAT